jgi:uncharacterized protein (DUF2461 family)
VSFGGFDPRAVELLAELPGLDERQYAEVRDLLAQGLRTPGAALIDAVAETLDTNLTVDRRSSVSPLHRDLRFAPPGTPRYKDHLLLTTWQGPDKKIAPTLWIRIDTDSVGFASGMAFTPDLRTRWRETVGSQPGQDLADRISLLTKKHRRHEIEVAGEQIKRVPKPWDDKHPRAGLLRRTGFQIRFREPLPGVVDKPAFAAWCVKRLQDLLPVHAWLVAELACGKGKKK